MANAAWLALGIAPGLLWVAFFGRRGQWSRAEAAHALWAFVMGGVATIGVIALRPVVEGWAPATRTFEGHNLVDAFLVTAPLEEGLKALAVTVVALMLGGIDARRGLILGLGAGLGFASAENAHYLTQPEVGLGILLARAFTSTLLHAAATAGLACFVGAALAAGSGRSRHPSRAWLAALAGVAGGVAFAWLGHGAFTLGTLLGGWAFRAGCLAVLPGMLLVVALLLRRTPAQPMPAELLPAAGGARGPAPHRP